MNVNFENLKKSYHESNLYYCVYLQISVAAFFLLPALPLSL